MNRKNNQQYSSIPVFARTIGFQTFPVSRIRAFISFLFLLILLTLIAGITAIVFIIHGILHLCGINDKGPGERKIMEENENKALELLRGM